MVMDQRWRSYSTPRLFSISEHGTATSPWIRAGPREIMYSTYYWIRWMISETANILANTDVSLFQRGAETTTPGTSRVEAQGDIACVKERGKAFLHLAENRGR
jgi:hypothetical protein